MSYMNDAGIHKTSTLPKPLDVVRPLIVELDRRAEVGLGALRPGVGHQQRELVRVQAMAIAEISQANESKAHKPFYCAKCSQDLS